MIELFLALMLIIVTGISVIASMKILSAAKSALTRGATFCVNKSAEIWTLFSVITIPD